MVPTDLDNLRLRRLILAIAGPAASLLLGLGALAALVNAKGSAWESYWELCAVTASVSLLSFALNLIPMRPEDQYSDGAHIYQILSNGPWADYHRATSVVASSLVTPLRPREYDIHAIRRASRSLTRGREALLLRLFAYQHHLDRGEVAEALQSVGEAEQVYEGIAASVAAPLHGDFVFASAMLKRDPAAAHRWWERMNSKKITRYDADYFKARCAYLWSQNLTEEAREAWRKGNALAAKLPSAGAYDFDRWCYAQLAEQLDSAAGVGA